MAVTDEFNRLILLCLVFSLIAFPLQHHAASCDTPASIVRTRKHGDEESLTADIISKPSEDVRWEILSSEGLAGSNNSFYQPSHLLEPHDASPCRSIAFDFMAS